MALECPASKGVQTAEFHCLQKKKGFKSSNLLLKPFSKICTESASSALNISLAERVGQPFSDEKIV